MAGIIQGVIASIGSQTPTPLGDLTWAFNFGNTTTIASPTVVTATTSTNSTNTGYVSTILPAQSCYFDVILDSGYSSSPTSVNFLGIGNRDTSIQWVEDDGEAYRAWYWSGSWYGFTPTTSTGGGNLNADTYRMAVNRSNNTLYMKKASSSTVVSASLPSPNTNLYLINLPQSGYRMSGATIVNGKAYAGSGGLY